MRVETLAPETIVLVGGPVYDAAFKKLKQAGLRVVEKPTPRRFLARNRSSAHDFRAALVKAGLETLIKPLTTPRRAPSAKGKAT